MADLLSLLRSNIGSNACGVEIGAHTLPVEGVSPYYIDQVQEFAGVKGSIDVQADAMALPIASGELDYLCSSHVLEHLANPVAALWEWARVVRRGGLLYLVIPDKRFTFDEPRELTRPEHLIHEFLDGNSIESDRTHIREFIYETDWRRLQPSSDPRDEATDRRRHYDHWISVLESGGAVDIHYHTFSLQSILDTLGMAGLVGAFFSQFAVVACGERYPRERGDGVGILLRKVQGPWRGGGGNATFSVQHVQRTIRPLPLVCPVYLEPLEAGANGTLGVSGRAHSYQFVGEVPVLLVPDGLSAERKWNSWLWRRVVTLLARLKRKSA